MVPEDRVVVTGAGGFVGSSLISHLHRLGRPVLGASRNPPAGANLPPMVRVDTRGGDAHWDGLFVRGDTIVHLAGRAHVMRESAREAERENHRVNYEGSLRLGEQALKAGAKRVVFVSTAKVFGEVSRPGAPFAPDDSPAPEGPYAQSKFAAERALASLFAGTSTELVIVRPPLVYGPNVRGNFARLLKLASGPLMLPIANVENRRSMVSIRNLISFLTAASDHPGASGEILLPTDGYDASTRELVVVMREAMGKTKGVFPLPGGSRVYPLAAKVSPVAQRLLGNFQLDGAASRAALGWRPPVSFVEGVTEAAQAYGTSNGL